MPQLEIRDLAVEYVLEEETVHAVIAIGHPAVTYQRLTGRKKPMSRFVEP